MGGKAKKKLNWSRLQDFWPWGLSCRDCWLLELQSQKEGDVSPCLWLRIYWSKPTKQQFIKINLNLKGLNFPGISAFSICVYTNGSWVSPGLSKKLLYVETHTWVVLPRGISLSDLFSQADLFFSIFLFCFVFLFNRWRMCSDLFLDMTWAFVGEMILQRTTQLSWSIMSIKAYLGKSEFWTLHIPNGAEMASDQMPLQMGRRKCTGRENGVQKGRAIERCRKISKLFRK